MFFTLKEKERSMKKFLSIVSFLAIFFTLAALEAASFRLSANTGVSSIFGNTT